MNYCHGLIIRNAKQQQQQKQRLFLLQLQQRVRQQNSFFSTTTSLLQVQVQAGSSNKNATAEANENENVNTRPKPKRQRPRPRPRPRRDTKIQIIGNRNEYDAVKQFRLIELPDENHPQPNLLASMHVKRNIIFGTRVHDVESYFNYSDNDRGDDDDDEGDDDVDDARTKNRVEAERAEREKQEEAGMCPTKNNWGYVKICKPLLKQCLDQAGVEGDQPQGLAALGGLSSHVRYLIDHPSDSESPIMERLKLNNNNDDNHSHNKLVYEAVVSVATQIPRPGHEVVGLGTYYDSRPGWTDLAKEYALARRGRTIVQGESQLFQSSGAVLVGIEYIGDEENQNHPDYWVDSGGAMARFIFA